MSRTKLDANIDIDNIQLGKRKRVQSIEGIMSLISSEPEKNLMKFNKNGKKNFKKVFTLKYNFNIL